MQVSLHVVARRLRAGRRRRRRRRDAVRAAVVVRHAEGTFRSVSPRQAPPGGPDRAPTSAACRRAPRSFAAPHRGRAGPRFVSAPARAMCTEWAARSRARPPPPFSLPPPSTSTEERRRRRDRERRLLLAAAAVAADFRRIMVSSSHRVARAGDRRAPRVVQWNGMEYHGMPSCHVIVPS